jgi:sRNA-binding regulator protein Hfq
MTQPKLKPPYVKKLDERGGLTIWIVDGEYIRGHIEEEFTNFAQHNQFPFIPKNELWIDQAANTDDQKFYIDNMLVMHRLTAKGVTYKKALAAAEQEERKERHRSGDVKLLTHHGSVLPAGKDVHLRILKKLKDGVTVWLVNGRLVRSIFDIEFTEGGHDLVYKFVPPEEVWIENDVEAKERPYILVHELHERGLMAKGWSYDKAHADSSRLEYRCRQHPEELHDALAKEGWGSFRKSIA